MPDNPRLPGNSDKLAVIGRNGSGKSVAAGFNFSLRNFDKMPWVIINSKGDELINKIAKISGVHSVKLDYTPKKPGIYIYNPIPEVDDDKLEALMWRIWKRGRTGIWCDEGYMIPQGSAFKALLTQGRSLKIPMIILMQRPVFMSKFVLTESNFFQVFDLSHKDDKDTLRKFMPYDVVETLPPYHSLWYDAPKRTLSTWKPVPDEKVILENIRRKIEPTTHLI